MPVQDQESGGIEQPLEGGSMSVGGPVGVPPGSQPAMQDAMGSILGGAGTQMPTLGGGFHGWHPLANLRAALAQRQALGQPPPTVSQQAQQHGGLISGLAGVLLDGLSAGMIAQSQAPLYGAPGSNFARGFVQQQQMPLYRQQQRQAMMDSLTAQQKDIYETLHAQIQAMQTRAAMQTEGENELMGATDEQRKLLEQDIKDGLTEKLAEGDDYDSMSKQFHAFRNQYGADGVDVWLKPTELHFENGKPVGSHWVIIKDDPNKTLDTPRTFRVPDGIDENGDTTYRNETVPADTKARDYRKIYEDRQHEGWANVDALRKQQAGIGPGAGDYVKVIGPSGKPAVMSRAEAAKGRFKVISPKVTSPEIDKWTTSQTEFNIAQKATSQYASAIQDEANLDEATKAKDHALMQEILNDPDIKILGNWSISIGPSGKVELPFADSVSAAVDRYARSKFFANLSPQAKRLFSAFKQQEAGAPAYSRAMLASARGASVQSVNLDLGMLPNPSLAVSDPAGAIGQMANFQGNIDVASAAIPQLEGVDDTDKIRQQYEQGYQSPQGASQQQELPGPFTEREGQALTGPGGTKGRIRNGWPVDQQGNRIPLQPQ